MADVKSGDVVVPGDQLCVIEELSPSFGTYETDGIVYAATFGQCEIDLKERVIRVVNPDGSMQLAIPVKGDILVGKVTHAYDQRAEVRIAKRNDETVLNAYYGELHISNVTRRFVKSMLDILQIGDIVRAIALNTHKTPVKLSLVGPELGVLYASCRICGNDLTLTTHNNMVCLRCENRETREVTNDYGVKFSLEVRPDLAPRRRSYRHESDSRRYDDRDRRDSRRYPDRRDDRPDSRRGGKRPDFRDRRRS